MDQPILHLLSLPYYHFFLERLNALDIADRSNLPFFGPRLNLMWFLLLAMYRCQSESLRLVFFAVLATSLTARLTVRPVRLTSPNNSLSSSRVPSTFTRLTTSVV